MVYAGGTLSARLAPLSLFLQICSAARRSGLFACFQDAAEWLHGAAEPSPVSRKTFCRRRWRWLAALAPTAFSSICLLNAEITWIFVVATVGAVFVAFGIGANDVANR